VKTLNFCYNDLNSSQNMQKKYQSRDRFNVIKSGEKRLIYKATGSEKAETIIQHEKIGEDRINKHRGKSAEKAKDNADQMLKTSENHINKIKEEWNNGFQRKLGNLTVWSGLGKWFNVGDKAQVRDLIEKSAEKRIKAEVEKIQKRGYEATAHAKDSITILNHRISASKELAANLEKDIRQREQLRDLYKENVLWSAGEKNISALNQEIEKSKKIQQFAGQILGEYQEKVDAGREKTQRIQQIEKGIIDFMVANGNPEDRPMLEMALREAVMNSQNGIFKSLVQERGFKRGDFIAISGMIDNLINGEGARNGFTKGEVQQYFSRKLVEEKVDVLNDPNETTEARIRKLETLPLGTKIKIGTTEYFLAKKENNPKGFLLKSRVENDHYAYINFAQPENPIFTEEKLTGQGEFLEPKKLEKKMGDKTDPLAVEFTTVSL
ncbi:MAG: hypothetical protein AB7J40_05595, partial [Candidatus Altimarinota bacterium]